MTEFFVTARSFAAPFFSDESEKYVEADTPVAALERFAADYSHPGGLYAAEAWRNADHFHKGGDPLARWLCNHEIEKQRLTRDLPGYSYLGHGPGDFEVNGERHRIANPKGGRVLALSDAERRAAS